MTDVGIEDEFIDTQDVSLENVTDSLVYKQVEVASFHISRSIEKNQLTDDTIDNLASLRFISIIGRLTVTAPDINKLISLTGDGVFGLSPPVKDWKITYSSSKATKRSITIKGQLFDFNMIDPGISDVQADFRLEGDETATVATPA